MFNPATISELKGIVGWRQPFNPDFAILDASNLTSRSGYFIDEHPMAKIETLKATQDFAGISNANFNTFLQNKQQASINNVCNAVFNEMVYIDRQVLFKNASNKINTTTLPDGFVGYRIRVTSKKNISFEIKRILLDFEGAGDIELLLFNTAQETDPLFSQVVTISDTHQAISLNWILDNSGDTYKGDYYLGYLSNYVDIGTVKPFKREFESGNIQSLVTGLFLERGFFSSVSTNVLPDLHTWAGQSDDIGLNPDIQVNDDFTDLIIQNQRLFARAIQLDMQASVIREILASLRSNKDQRRAENSANFLIQSLRDAEADFILAIDGIKEMDEIKKIKSGYFPDGIFVTTTT